MARKSNKALSDAGLTDNVADLYIRVSTTEQAEEGYSVGEQESKLRAYCVACGITINAVHIDPGYSGSNIDRPGIKEVINDVKIGKCKKVIVWKLDRLSRSQKDTLVLLEDVFLANDCNFISIMESFDTSTPFGRCIVGILAAFAQMERENIKARTIMGKQAGLKEGNYYSVFPPRGYRYEQVKGKRTLVIDNYTSQSVVEMYELYDAGLSLNKIAQTMIDKYGMYKGCSIANASSRVACILRNPVYKGNVKMNDLECKGRHEALVSVELWNRVNAELANNDITVKRKYGKTSCLLSSMIYCGKCGAHMSPRRWKRLKSEKYYICYSVSKTKTDRIKDPDCDNRHNHFTVEGLDNLVVEEIRKLYVDPAALDGLMAENESKPPVNVQVYLERLTEIEKQIKRLMNLYQTGVIELDMIRDRLSDLKSERAGVRTLVDNIEKERHSRMSVESVRASLATLDGIIEDEDNMKLYNLVHSLIDRVEVYNGVVTIRWSFC